MVVFRSTIKNATSKHETKFQWETLKQLETCLTLTNNTGSVTPNLKFLTRFSLIVGFVLFILNHQNQQTFWGVKELLLKKKKERLVTKKPKNIKDIISEPISS